MKSGISVIAIVLLGLLAPLAAAQNSVVPNPSGIAASPATSAHRGALFRIRHKGNTSYLFGTIHVGKPAFYPLGAVVEQALQKASKIAVELDIQRIEPLQGAMRRHGLYGPDDALEKHLSPTTFARLKEALAKLKLPLESVAQMKPWLVASLLMELDLARGGYERNHGVEEHLLTHAKQQKKQVVELESAEFQFSLFSQMSEAVQEQFLAEMLTAVQDGKSRKETDALANAWMQADAKEMARLIAVALGEKSASSEFTQRVLLDQRNPGMADKIEGLLKHDKVTFVGVGLLHLIGEGSVPELLRRRGYGVERVY